MASLMCGHRRKIVLGTGRWPDGEQERSRGMFVEGLRDWEAFPGHPTNGIHDDEFRSVVEADEPGRSPGQNGGEPVSIDRREKNVRTGPEWAIGPDLFEQGILGGEMAIGAGPKCAVGLSEGAGQEGHPESVWRRATTAWPSASTARAVTTPDPRQPERSGRDRAGG